MTRMSAQPRVPVGSQVVVHGTPADAARPGVGRGLAGRVVRDSGDENWRVIAEVFNLDDQLAALPEPGKDR